MDLGLTGKSVFITAGANGIGREIALRFREEGASVAICDIDETAIAELDALDPEIRTSLCDVSDSRKLADCINQAAEAQGGLDCLVNNAGIAGPTARLEDIDDDSWQHTITVCLSSQFYASRAAIPHLKRSTGGSIINLSSAAGRFGFAMRSPYSAAKWGVIGLTKTLAIELGEEGIRVNAILPGFVAGDRQRRVMEAKSQQCGISFEAIEAEAFSYSSVKDYVTATHIADQCLFLASERGRMISGQALAIDGDTKMLA